MKVNVGTLQGAVTRPGDWSPMKLVITWQLKVKEKGQVRRGDGQKLQEKGVKEQSKTGQE